MKKLTSKCQKCDKVFELTSGTVKTGAEAMVKEYGDDWLKVVQQRDGERLEKFADDIMRHRCNGKIHLVSVSFLD